MNDKVKILPTYYYYYLYYNTLIILKIYTMHAFTEINQRSYVNDCAQNMYFLTKYEARRKQS